MSLPKPSELRGEALHRYENWRLLGMSESAALREVVGDGLVELEPFDRFVETFKALGLSESAARIAAIGYDGTESRARERWAAAAQVSEGALSGLSESERASLRAETVSTIEAAAKSMSGPSARSKVISLVERELTQTQGTPAARVAKTTEALKQFRKSITIREVGR